MEPSSTSTKPGATAAAADHARFQNESSPVTAALPGRLGTLPTLPRGLFFAALVLAAILPAIFMGAMFSLVLAAQWNLLNWME